MADISKITLPSGTTYDIKDAVARAAAQAGLQLVVVDTLPTASADTMGKMYLVPDTSGADPNVKIEYVTVRSGSEGSYTYKWEQVGTSKTDLTAYAKKGTYAGTFTGSGTAANKTVSFAAHTTDKVLGTGTTFGLGTTSVSTGEVKKYIKATASGAAVGANGTANAITGFGTHTTVNAVPSVTPTSQKLALDSVIGVTGSTTASKVSITAKTASKATAGTAVSVATVGTAKDVAKAGTAVTVGDGTVTATTTNTDILKSISVSNETLSFGACSLDTTSVVPAVANGSVVPAVANGTITPYTFTDVACSAVSASDVTVPVADEDATTVATGSLTSTGDGASVVSSVSVGTAAKAISALGTPTTAAALTGVKVTTQPTITLANTGTGVTGEVQVLTDVVDSITVPNSVTVGTNDQVDAITALGAATAPGQTISVSGTTSTTI